MGEAHSSSSTRWHALRFGALAAWCALVWYLSAQSDPEKAVGFYLHIPDKVAHVLEFAVGGFLAHAAFRPFAGGRTFVVAMAFCAVNAMVDEVHQSFVPERFSSLADFSADLLGGALGALVNVARLARWPSRGHSGATAMVHTTENDDDN